ncbi:hypothetical protein HP550_19950 [Cellulomonas humilata]|uniref:Uncharacterized protein n=1 Tax=Cellulomonas humilata TaxID=144055 RepID=A0A7Y6A4B6_9CELL|nr:hypothetical protein [Cellulomonas humilata]NUU19528.1 hypothetical protein [Cellulomonas humilata]
MNTWRDWFTWTPRWMRWAAGISVTLGVALLTIGIALDVQGRWNNYPYLVNMTSAFTGALIGIPVTAFVLAFVLDDARQVRVTRQVRDGVKDALIALDHLAIELLSPLESEVPHRLQVVGQLRTLLAGPGTPADNVLYDEIARGAVSGTENDLVLAKVRTQWQRVQGLGALANMHGTGWLDVELVDGVAKAVRELTEPSAELWERRIPATAREALAALQLHEAVSALHDHHFRIWGQPPAARDDPFQSRRWRWRLWRWRWHI